jgi:DNA recombination protein Rad52
MTAFSNEIVESLAAPLAREHVKERDQGRNKVSYIEGWHAIAEANRIFGFDCWTRETVMSECCYAGEYEKAVWENGRKTNRTTTSFRCSYRARVRVTVLGIVREGTGHGHGFADNPGEAHESAEKEAETDAMKRALMTFGNPFGLALYDKKQAEVEPVSAGKASRSASIQRQHLPEDDPFADPAPRAPQQPKERPFPGDLPPLSEAAREFIATLRKRISDAKLPSKIDDLIKANGNSLARLREDSEPAYADVMAFATITKNELFARAP